MIRIITLIICSLIMFGPDMAHAKDEGKLLLIRKPIDMTYGASPLLAVVFNHSSHRDVKCRTCHHKATEDGKRFVNCTVAGCHSQPGARLRNPESMFMAYHARGTDRSCYGCHKAEAASHPQFVGCRPCHMNKFTREAIAAKEAPTVK